MPYYIPIFPASGSGHNPELAVIGIVMIIIALFIYAQASPRQTPGA